VTTGVESGPARDTAKRPTAARLIAAAETEFRKFGYLGTNSNQIAHRAGFAPQTFYRHFSDKLEIFFAVYENWTQKEIDLLGRSDDIEEISDIIISHHWKYRIFRRDLRRLTVDNEAVGELRAASRRRLLAKFGEINPSLESIGWAQRMATLLIIERLADAIADGEFAHLGVSKDEARTVLANILGGMLSNKTENKPKK